MTTFLFSGIITFVAGCFTCGGVFTKSDLMVATSFIATMLSSAAFAMSNTDPNFHYWFFDLGCYVLGIIFFALMDDDPYAPHTSTRR